MNRKILDLKVRERFGSVERFLKVVGKTRREYNKMTDKEILFRINNQKGKLVMPEDLTPELLKMIRDKIYLEHGNQSNFCRKFGYSVYWLNALINGNHKRISSNVKKVLNDLKIDHVFNKQTPSMRKVR